MKQNDKEFWRGMYNLATVGINIVAATFIGLGIGWVLDNKVFHGRTSPWFTLSFLILGIIAGFRNVFLIVKEMGGVGSLKSGEDTEEGQGGYDDKDEDKKA